ncbi:flavoprotein [Streptomyces sp. NPDC050732]|uniref:flavoprotein n=1 Tax=Streptomyces sp. NPDC050732 TaxID=3154632 RepID=UPI00341E3FF0
MTPEAMTAEARLRRPGRPHVLIGACGSANILNLPTYLTTIASDCGAELRVVLTASAGAFLPAASLRLLVERVAAADDPPLAHNHVEWARWADLVCVLPATAHTIAAAAHGLADSFLTTTLLAHHHSVTFFPSMNEQMLGNPAVRRNIKTLREDGHQIVLPRPGLSYEAASGTYEERLSVPGPEAVARYVSGALRLRTGAAGKAAKAETAEAGEAPEVKEKGEVPEAVEKGEVSEAAEKGESRAAG